MKTLLTIAIACAAVALHAAATGRLTVTATVVAACAIGQTPTTGNRCTTGVTPQITLYPRATASQPTLRGDVMEVVF